MLFKKQFHAGIRDGRITLTFRAWTAPRVRVDTTYRFQPNAVVRVESLRQVALGDIREVEARASGFADRADLVAYLERTSSRRLNAKSKVFRVSFRYEPAEAPVHRAHARPSRAAIEEVATRLRKMDRLSKRDPWTREVLRLIERRPRTAASRLAPLLGRETQPFKADVRKLKRLGLTLSFEVGYEVTPLGRAVLARQEDEA